MLGQRFPWGSKINANQGRCDRYPRLDCQWEQTWPAFNYFITMRIEEIAHTDVAVNRAVCVIVKILPIGIIVIRL